MTVGSHKRPFLMLGVLVAALAAVTVAVVARGPTESLDDVKTIAGIPVAGGPLARDVEYSSQVPGEHPVFTDGQMRLMLTGTEPATITRVTSNGSDGVAEVLGVRVSGPDRRLGTRQWSPAWPPRPAFGPTIVDAVGAEIRPASESRGMGAELLVGYRLLAPDELGLARTSLTIEYVVGSTRYAYTERASLFVCPEQVTARACTRAWNRADTGY